MEPRAAGGWYTAKFVFYNDVDRFCGVIYYLAVSKVVGKADREKLHGKCVGAPGESRRSGARKLCFQYLVQLYQLPVYPMIGQF